MASSPDRSPLLCGPVHISLSYRRSRRPARIVRSKKRPLICTLCKPGNALFFVSSPQTGAAFVPGRLFMPCGFSYALRFFLYLADFLMPCGFSLLRQRNSRPDESEGPHRLRWGLPPRSCNPYRAESHSAGYQREIRLQDRRS